METQGKALRLASLLKSSGYIKVKVTGCYAPSKVLRVCAVWRAIQLQFFKSNWLNNTTITSTVQYSTVVKIFFFFKHWICGLCCGLMQIYFSFFPPLKIMPCPQPYYTRIFHISVYIFSSHNNSVYSLPHVGIILFCNTWDHSTLAQYKTILIKK